MKDLRLVDLRSESLVGVLVQFVLWSRQSGGISLSLRKTQLPLIGLHLFFILLGQLRLRLFAHDHGIHLRKLDCLVVVVIIWICECKDYLLIILDLEVVIVRIRSVLADRVFHLCFPHHYFFGA